MKRSADGRETSRPTLPLLFAAATLFAALLGFAPALLDADTPTYLDAYLSPMPFSQPRHPLYGFFLHHLPQVGRYNPVVAAQALTFLWSAVLMYGASLRFGLSWRSAALFALATIASYPFLYYVRILVPELPAISFALAGLAFCLLALSGPARVGWLLAASISFSLAIFLRPTFIPGALIMPLTFFLLARRLQIGRALPLAILLFAATMTPFLLQAGIRKATVGNFNLTSFGGFTASALAGQLLDAETIARLPPEQQQTGREVLAAREQAERDGLVIRIPVDRSTGEVNLNSALRSYYDIFARNFDYLLHDKIKKLQRPGESWVEFDNRLGAFSAAALPRMPDRWASWSFGALGRTIGKMFVNNLSNLVCLIVFIAVAIVYLATPPVGSRPAREDESFTIYCTFCVAWILSWSPLIIVMSFPHTRYTSTAGFLLGPTLIVAALALYDRMRGAPRET